MAERITMPPMGQTTKNLKILAWHKKTGDSIRQGEVLLEVETDKATVEVESYASGTVLKTLYAEGDVVEVGSPIAYVGEPGEEPGDVADAAGSKAAAAGADDPAKTAEGPARRPFEAGPSGRPLASPVARKLAREHGIELASLTGTGPGGRIRKQDVLAAARKPDAGAPAFAPKAEESTARIVEMSRVRKAVAERLAYSFQNIPHIYLTSRVDMSAAARRLSAGRKDFGVKLTYTHLLLRAAGEALRVEPAMNRLWLGDGRMKLLGRSSVGLAVAGEESLIVITIAEPDRMSLAQLAQHTAEAVTRARAGRLTGEDLAECALTLSNLGMYGVQRFSAIIDPQQTAILAIGRIADEPVARDGGLFACPVMSVTLSADHRIVDGVNAARFLSAFGTSVQAVD